MRRAYPAHDNGDTRETKLRIRPFFSEDTDDDSSSMGDNQNRALTTTNEEFDTTQHKYNLRSTSNFPDLPRVMSKPEEYT